MYQSVKDLVRTAEIQQKALSELVIEADVMNLVAIEKKFGNGCDQIY